MAENVTLPFLHDLTTTFLPPYHYSTSNIKAGSQVTLDRAERFLTIIHRSLKSESLASRVALAVVALAASLIIYYIWYKFCSFQGLPETLPWAGVGRANVLRRGNVTRKSLFGLRNLLTDGYNNVGVKLCIKGMFLQY